MKEINSLKMELDHLFEKSYDELKNVILAYGEQQESGLFELTSVRKTYPDNRPKKVRLFKGMITFVNKNLHEYEIDESHLSMMITIINFFDKLVTKEEVEKLFSLTKSKLKYRLEWVPENNTFIFGLRGAETTELSVYETYERILTKNFAYSDFIKRGFIVHIAGEYDCITIPNNLPELHHNLLAIMSQKGYVPSIGDITCLSEPAIGKAQISMVYDFKTKQRIELQIRTTETYK